MALVSALQPMLTGCLAGPLLGERLRRRQWVGLLVGFAGVVIVIANRITLDPTTPSWAYALLVLSTFGLTAATVRQRAWENRAAGETPPVVENLAVQCVASTLVLLPGAWGLEGFRAQWNDTGHLLRRSR